MRVYTVVFLACSAVLCKRRYSVMFGLSSEWKRSRRCAGTVYVFLPVTMLVPCGSCGQRRRGVNAVAALMFRPVVISPLGAVRKAVRNLLKGILISFLGNIYMYIACGLNKKKIDWVTHLAVER